MYSSSYQNPYLLHSKQMPCESSNLRNIALNVHTHPTNVRPSSLGSYPLLPNSSFHFSNARNDSLLTLGRIFRSEVTKSSKSMGRISSRFVVKRASPRERRGPIAASFVSAVISDPENPTHISQGKGSLGGVPSVIETSCSNCSSVNV
jgi:hypothetical protein